MMKKLKLGELLLHEGVISPEQLQQALENQTVYGGRLGTNLVDLGIISLDTLANILAMHKDCPNAGPEVLSEITSDLFQRIPKEICAKYNVFPLFIENEKLLHLAMCDPMNLLMADELSFALGLSIQPWSVPELRLLYLLEKNYGIVRDARFVRLAQEKIVNEPRRRYLQATARTAQAPPGMAPNTYAPQTSQGYGGNSAQNGQPYGGEASAYGGRNQAGNNARPGMVDPASMARPNHNGYPQGQPAIIRPAYGNQQAVAEEPREKSSGPEVIRTESSEYELVFLDEIDGQPKAETGDFEIVVDDEEEQPQNFIASRAFVDPSAPPAPCGPIVSIEEIFQNLNRAADGRMLAELLVQPIFPFVDFSLVFMVRGEFGIGIAAMGTPATDEEVKRFAISLGSPSMLQKALVTRGIVCGKAKNDPLTNIISSCLYSPTSGEVSAVPILLGDRVINLLYLQSIKGTFSDDTVTVLKKLSEHASAAYVRLINQKRS